MKTYNLKKILFLNKYLTNPYVHCSYSDAQRRTVVRQFVRLLSGFDKGKISDFINKTRVQCVCLMHIHQALFIAPRTFISHCWSGFQPRFIRMSTVLEGFQPDEYRKRIRL